METKASKQYKIMKTVLMNFAPIALGMYLEIAGPTLPDLMHKLGINYEEIARSLVARSVGYFISSILAGMITDILPRHLELMLAVSLGIAAIATGLVPWSTELWLLSFFFHLQGLAQGSIDTFGNSLCARMWGKKASVPLHGMHLGFGIGALIAPQLARPFISEATLEATAENTVDSMYKEQNNTLYQSNNTTVLVNYKNGTTDTEYENSVHMPYTISSLIAAIFALIYFSFYIYEKSKRITTDARLLKTTKERNDESQIALKDCSNDKTEIPENKTSKKLVLLISPGSCTGGDTIFGIKAFLLIFLYYINIVGGERVYGKFIYSYALTSKNNMGRDSATLLNSLFWVSFTLGRFIALVLAKYIRMRNYILINLLFNIICGICLSVWGFDNTIILYIFTCILGLALSPLFPNCMAWINLYIDLKGMAVALVFTGGACGGMIYQWLGGYMFQYHGAQSMMYIMLSYTLILSSTYGLLLLLVRNRPIRFHTTLKSDSIKTTQDRDNQK